MKTNSVSSQSFGEFRYGQSVLRNVFSEKVDREVLLNLQKLTYALKSKYDTNKKFDVVVVQAADKSFYAVIDDKFNGHKMKVISLDEYLK